MSYNGTVTCRYCYGRGHNSRTCPDKTEVYRRRAQSEVDNGEGREGYWHKEYAKRTGKWLNGDAANEMKKKRRGGVRRCKYCNKPGHNTRTCPELATAKNEYERLARLARQRVLNGMKEIGLGIGALVQMDEYGSPVLYFVQDIYWDRVNHETLASNSNMLNLKRLSNASNTSRWYLNQEASLPMLGEMPEGITQYNAGRQPQLVGPLPQGRGVQPPEGWEGLEDIDFKKVFADRQSPDWHDNRWNY